MTPVREAFVVPVLFLTVGLLGGLRLDDRVALAAPPLFALVLSVMAIGLLVRGGALAPGLLVHDSRRGLANVNGGLVMATLFLATAQAFALTTPESGLPRVLVNVFFLALLANTFAASPDRERVLRSLLVVVASGFVIKFVVLAGLSAPPVTLAARAARLLLEGATLGSVTQEAMHPATGYVAFFTLLLYFAGLTLLPGRGRPGLPRRSLPSAPECA